MRREKRLAFALLAYAAGALLLLVPECAQAEQACGREGDRVCCGEASFGVLVGTIGELQAELSRCQTRVELPPSCPVLPPLPDAPTAAPAPRIGPPLLGLASGVASTVLLSVALLAPLPTPLRATTGVLALGGLTAGVVLVLP